VSDLKLREDLAGQPSSELQMKAGDVKWFPRGVNHATTNAGTSAATFITLEFNRPVVQ
jgi:quercetin dioxygenase-like cupin family protein